MSNEGLRRRQGTKVQGCRLLITAAPEYGIISTLACWVHNQRREDVGRWRRWGYEVKKGKVCCILAKVNNYFLGRAILKTQ